MFGLDDWIANFSDGATVGLIVVVAVLLGLRHASDPDHLAAVSTLIASGKDRTKRAAARLGLTWGLGHATTLFAFGLPIVLFKTYLPEPVQEGAEASVGLVIMALAVWLLVRWRRGLFHVHVHAHGGTPHVHGHTHGAGRDHAHQITARSPLQAYAIGLVHGMGGSAGVGILLLATIHNRGVAVGALAVFALFTAVSMSIMSTTFGMTLSSGPMRRSFNRVAPALGTASLLFGLWYALGALTITPYYF
jgi:high-affinity nickel permease